MRSLLGAGSASGLRFGIMGIVALLAAASSDVNAQPPLVEAIKPAPTLAIDPSDELYLDPGIDLMPTGAIDPLLRDAGIGAAGGMDALQPSAIHYRLPESRVRDALGLPLPDTDSPVVIGAPSVKTMIGARLLGDENVLKSHLPSAQQEAILKIYEARGFEPLWIKDADWSEAAQSVLAVLANARSHGLSPMRYLVPSIASKRVQALADADIRLSVAAVIYARDARGGLLDREKIGVLAMPKLDLPTAGDVLAALEKQGGKAGQILEAYQPKTAGYQALRSKLLALQKLNYGQQDRKGNGQPMARLPDSPALRLDHHDEKFVLLQGKTGLSPADDPAIMQRDDRALAEAAAAFQEHQKQHPHGVVSATSATLALADATVSILPTGPAEMIRLEAALRINMERWRWIPQNTSDRHVVVNVPEQRVKLIEGGRVIWQAAGVVGQVETPTPIFSGMINDVVLNPDWYLLPHRIKNEIVPGIKCDNNYARDRGFEISREGRNIRVREPAKVRYELGQVKFMLAQNPSFYLHNTPDHTQFEKEMRLQGKGSVRVDKPLQFAEILLGKKWTEEKLGKLIGGGERHLRLAKPLPIHVTYFTMAVGDDGKIVTYSDVYNYDDGLKKALGFSL